MEAGPGEAVVLHVIYDSFQKLWCRQPGPKEVQVRTRKAGGCKGDSDTTPEYFRLLDDAFFNLPARTFNFINSTQQPGVEKAATNMWKEMLTEGLDKGHWDDKVNAKS